MRSRTILSIIAAIIISLSLTTLPSSTLVAQEPKVEEKADETDNLSQFMEDSMQEIDFYSLEELLDVEIEIASLFEEDELVVGSTVSRITADEWKMLGARRMHEAFNNEPGVFLYPNALGTYALSVRGYASSGSAKGIATFLDGIPLNEIVSGSVFTIPNWELGTLEKIELIKGPGSAIYGSYAFHGVVSMKTFESEKDHYSIEGAAVSPHPQYYDGNVKISRGLYDNLIRIDIAAAAARQRKMEEEYEYSAGTETDTATRDWNHDSQSGVVKLKINPLKKLKLKVSMYYSGFECDEYPGTAMGLDGSSLQDRDYYLVDNTVYLGRGSITYTPFSNISVEVMSYFSKADSYSKAAVSSGGLDYIIDQKGDQTGFNLTIKQPDNDLNLQWLVAYSFDYNMELDAVSKTVSGSNTFIPEEEALHDGITRKVNSAFCQVKWGAIKNSLYLLAGARYDHYSDFGSQFTPRGGIIYLPADKSSVKALYGRGFRAPNGLETKGLRLYTEPAPDLKPETLDMYELIYIYKEKTWKINATVFYSRWLDAIILEDAPVASSFIYSQTNRGENDAYGGELSCFVQRKPWAFDLGFGYVMSRAIDVADTGNPDKKINQRYDAFPEYSVNCGIYYFLKFIEVTLYLNNRAYFNMYEAPSLIRDDPEKLPAYYRMDVNISKIISEKLEIYLDIRNVLNRENHIPSVFGAMNGYVEPGTSVMLRAEYKF